ncbi:hypothetical protein HK102_008177, partial [Quaeritorhiza haematococci]
MARKRKKKEDAPSVPAPKRPPGFWHPHCDEIADRLWTPLKTNDSFAKTPTGSWFTMGSWSGTHTAFATENPRDLDPILRTLGDPPPKKAKKGLQAKKIPILLSKHDSKTIKKWFNDARFMYNKALEIIKKDMTNNKFHFNKAYFSHLRWRLVTEDHLKKEWEFLIETPSKIRAATIVNDLFNAFKSNFEKCKINLNHTFDIKFCSKKDLEQSISIQKDLFPKKGTNKFFFPTRIRNTIRLSSNYAPPDRITTDCRLIRTKEGRFYLCVPMDDLGVDNQDPAKQRRASAIALDPGVRTFQTGYSIDHGVCYEFGNRDIGRIMRLKHHQSELQQQVFKTRSYQRRKRYIKALDRMRRRQQHLMKD